MGNIKIGLVPDPDTKKERWGSNPRPKDYESSALTAELQPRADSKGRESGMQEENEGECVMPAELGEEKGGQGGRGCCVRHIIGTTERRTAGWCCGRVGAS